MIFERADQCGCVCGCGIIKPSLFSFAFAGLPRGGVAEDVGWARECKAKSKPPVLILSPQASTRIVLLCTELVVLTGLKSPLQVIIDSQPLTVAILASLLFGESIGAIGAGGLVLGVAGLLLLEVLLSADASFKFKLFLCIGYTVGTTREVSYIEACIYNGDKLNC